MQQMCRFTSLPFLFNIPNSNFFNHLRQFSKNLLIPFESTEIYLNTILNTKNLAIDNLSTPTAYTTIQSQTTKHNHTRGENLRLDEENNDKTHYPFPSHIAPLDPTFKPPIYVDYTTPPISATRYDTLMRHQTNMYSYKVHRRCSTTPGKAKANVSNTTSHRSHERSMSEWYCGKRYVPPPPTKKDQRDRIEANRK